jgi:hypothetical protein
MATKNPTFYHAYAPLTQIEKANQLDISVFYAKGGINYYNYQTDPAGYWVSVNPVTVERHAETGFTSIAYGLFSGQGGKVFLKSAARFHANTLKTLAKAVFAEKHAIAEAFDNGGKEAAFPLLRTFKEAAPAPVVAVAS